MVRSARGAFRRDGIGRGEIAGVGGGAGIRLAKYRPRSLRRAEGGSNLPAKGEAIAAFSICPADLARNHGGARRRHLLYHHRNGLQRRPEVLRAHRALWPERARQRLGGMYMAVAANARLALHHRKCRGEAWRARARGRHHHHQQQRQ